MGLFNSEKVNSGEIKKDLDLFGNEIVEKEDTSYLMDFVSDGDVVSNSNLPPSYLGIIQQKSAGENKPFGNWFNATTNEVYGKSLKVIVIDYAPVWIERDDSPKHLTVGRYIPGSISVTKRYRQPGKLGPLVTMTNPETGYEVLDTYSFALCLPDYDEAGIVIFTVGKSSLRTVNNWIKAIQSTRIPGTGVKAAPYIVIWQLDLIEEPNPKSTSAGDLIARIGTFKRVEFLSKELCLQNKEIYSTFRKENKLLLNAPQEDAE